MTTEETRKPFELAMVKSAPSSAEDIVDLDEFTDILKDCEEQDLLRQIRRNRELLFSLMHIHEVAPDALRRFFELVRDEMQALQNDSEIHAKHLKEVQLLLELNDEKLRSLAICGFHEFDESPSFSLSDVGVIWRGIDSEDDQKER